MSGKASGANQYSSSRERGAFRNLNPSMTGTPTDLMSWLGSILGGSNWQDPSAQYSGQLSAPMSGGERSAGNFFDNFSPDDFGSSDELRETLSGKYLSPDSNPYLADTAVAAQQPMMNQWNEEILPGIKGEAQKMGAMTSDAYGNTVREAGRDLTKNLGDVSSGIYGNAYDNERNRMMAAAGLSPSVGMGPLDQAEAQRAGGAAVRGVDQDALDRFYNEFVRRLGGQGDVMQSIIDLLTSALGGEAQTTSKSWGLSHSAGGGMGAGTMK